MSGGSCPLSLPNYAGADPLSSLLSLSTTATPRLPARPAARSLASLLVAQATSLQFVKGVKETSVPDVKLTRARDGASGVATFVFAEPSIFEASSELGDITGLYMEDDEGVLSTVDVQVCGVERERERKGWADNGQRLAFFLDPASLTTLGISLSLSSYTGQVCQWQARPHRGPVLHEVGLRVGPVSFFV